MASEGLRRPASDCPSSEGLRHPVLDCRFSLASNLPRLWVIEVLASSRRANISLLLDLVKKTPEIVEDIGDSAREWVSLRILESFYNQGVGANSLSFSAYKKIGFDPSERCVDVLRRILQEASMSDLKIAGLEMLKWDFHPFIEHKRSSLAKCSLQKLKDAIIVGSHPLSSSLKEKSALLGGNQPEDKVPVEESNDNDITHKPDGNKTNTQIGVANDQLTSLTPANSNSPLYKNMTDQNLLRSKRKRSSTVESDDGMQLPDTHGEGERCILGKKSHVVGPGKDGSFRDDNNEHTSLKRHAGHDEVLPCQNQVHNFVPYDTYEDCGGLHLLGNALSMILQNSEGVISGSRKKINVGGTGTNSPSRVCNNNQTSTKGVFSLDVISPCEKHAYHRDTDMPNEAFDEEQEQDHVVNDADGDKEGISGLKTSEKGVKPRQNILINVSETEDGYVFCGNDVYHDDMTDIARRKNAFLHSQFTHSQDSLEKVDWRELSCCIKCNKSGKLLICSSSSCSSAIHESCLGSDAIIEKIEEFQCPFCAYSLALSNYLEAKAKVSLARKDMATFLSWGSRKQYKEKFCRSCGIVQNHIEQEDDSDKSKERTGDFGKKVNNLLSRKKIGCEEVGPSVSSSGGNPPRKGLASINELTRGLDKDKQEGEGMGQESQSPRVRGQNQMAAMANNISECEKTLRSKKDPQESDFLSDSTSLPINDSNEEDEILGEGSEDSDFSKYFISIRKHKRSSNTGTPQLRRKRVPWTIEEELTLKNGMQRFCVDHKNIPWKKILDYGENVFHESRTTVDLKDKWKNVKKLLEKFHPSDEDAQVT